MELNSMFKLLRKLLGQNKKENVDLKYMRKYSRLVHPHVYNELLKQYRDGPIIFEPVRKKISEEDLDRLYSKIDTADFLSNQEKFETIVTLMYLIDGSFPENDKIMSRLEKIFGKDFIKTVEVKRKEFGDIIAQKKLIEYIKNKKFST